MLGGKISLAHNSPAFVTFEKQVGRDNEKKKGLGGDKKNVISERKEKATKEREKRRKERK